MKISTNNMPMFELNHLIEINPYLSAQVIFNAHAFGHNWPSGILPGSFHCVYRMYNPKDSLTSGLSKNEI